MTFLSHKQEPYFPGSFSINLKKRKGIKRKKLFFNDWRNTMLIFKNLVCDCAKVVFRNNANFAQLKHVTRKCSQDKFQFRQKPLFPPSVSVVW